MSTIIVKLQFRTTKQGKNTWPWQRHQRPWHRYRIQLKYEEVYLHDYQMPREAHQGLARYFEFYNHIRPHQALGYLPPAEFYFHQGGAGPTC